MSRLVSGILVFLPFITTGLSVGQSDILVKRIPFPSYIQWKTIGGVEVSLIAAAWGPANSPEMFSKGREKFPREEPAFPADRPYALALQFQAKAPGTFQEMFTPSGLVRITNVGGDLELPQMLTPSGFVRSPGAQTPSDIHFHHSNKAEFWDFFPAPADQNEFLFQVFPPSGSLGVSANLASSFRVILKHNDLVITNALPVTHRECSDFTKSFAGTIGPKAQVNLQLAAEGSTLSGTEQYARVGTTLWLAGQVDSFGNFVLEERYPKDRVTGILKGKFSPGCRTLSGYFSKPDGSRLLPFDFQEAESTK